MDSLDNETLEQIKTIVNDAKNEKAPLQRAKRTKKQKDVTIIIPPTEEHKTDTEPVEMIPARPILKRSDSVMPPEELKPIMEEELKPNMQEEDIVLIVPEKRKEYRVKNKKRRLFCYKQKEKNKLKNKN